jgi:hypothetical protein
MTHQKDCAAQDPEFGDLLPYALLLCVEKFSAQLNTVAVLESRLLRFHFSPLILRVLNM